MHDPPVPTDCSNGFKAARGQLVGPGEAAVHSPVEQVDLIWVQLQ